MTCPDLRLAGSVAAVLLYTASTALAADAPPDDASAALVFEEQLDGRCQILSAGGKLVIMRNTHAGKAVRYRLVRLFLGVPQGRVDGEIAPGADPQKLGCSRVNGRRQSWRVERAALVTPATKEQP